MIRVELAPNPDEGWRVAIDYGEAASHTFFKTKFFALLYARGEAKKIHRQTGRTVSLKIKKKDGRYQEERTYGPDPAETRG